MDKTQSPLFEPLTIGSLTLGDRVFKSATSKHAHPIPGLLLTSKFRFTKPWHVLEHR